MPVRLLHPAAALIKLSEKMRDRWDEAKAKSLACQSALPPRLMLKLHETNVAAAKIPVDKIKFTTTDKRSGTVPLNENPTKTASVNMEMMYKMNRESCDRCCSVVTGLPCSHQVAFANAGGHDFVDFMNVLDTTAGWVKQYENVTFHLPSEAEYAAQEHLWDTSLRLVPPYKRQRGRPSLKRKKGFLERETKAKVITCQRCFKKGHTKRSGMCIERHRAAGEDEMQDGHAAGDANNETSE